MALVVKDSGPLFVQGETRVGSKAQAALAKIIAVISTVPSPSPTTTTTTTLNSKPSGDPKAAAGVVDLNLRLGPEIVLGAEPADDNGCHSSLILDPVLPTAGDESISPAESVAGNARPTAEKSSEGECDPEEEKKKDEDDANEEEISEVTNIQAPSMASEGYLDLILQAVQHELAPMKEEEKAELLEKTEPAIHNNSCKRVRSSSSSAKKSREAVMNWTAAFGFYDEEETAPVVRSKRGRNQTLPSRYRDSVIEPWAKPPTVNRHDGTVKATARRRRRTTTP